MSVLAQASTAATRLKQSTKKEPGHPKFPVPRALQPQNEGDAEFRALRHRAVQAVTLMEEPRGAGSK